jgi:biotin transport system ATP-binding protein
LASLELVSIDVAAAGGRLLLQGLNGRFDDRDFTVVAGPTGSGKSCLARLLAGHARPAAGSLLADGIDARRRPAALRSLVALAPQDPSSGMVADTVRAEIGFGLRSTVGVDGLLEWAQLGSLAGEDPRFLSFGERRRLAIATALAARTGIVILDDPFQGLDHAFIPRLVARLVEHHAAGHGVILFTNEFEKVLAHANRLVLLKQGRIIADALPERVLPYLDAHGFRKPAMKLAEMTWL